MSKRITLSLAIIVALILAACGSSEVDTAATAAAVQTGAAETVNAQYTLNAQLTPSATFTVPPSNTPDVSPTASATATATTESTGGTGTTAGGGCDVMGFVSDVTIPDGEDVNAGATFTKTWRLRNDGTCTWTTSYNVVFNNGTQMSGPTTQALTASIEPGATVDVSISLTAPAANGSYTGAWNLRNAAGQNFGYFYVQIDVVGGTGSGTPTATGTGSGQSVTVNPNAVGQVHSDGTVDTSAAHIGDSDTDAGVQGFVSFSLSGITSGSTINSVSANFSSFDMVTDPFVVLGCMRGYAGSYFALGAGDYNTGVTNAQLNWCSSGEMANAISNDALKAAVQNALAAGSIEFLLKFDTETDSDGAAALVRLFGGVSLTISYTAP